MHSHRGPTALSQNRRHVADARTQSGAERKLKAVAIKGSRAPSRAAQVRVVRAHVTWMARGRADVPQLTMLLGLLAREGAARSGGSTPLCAIGGGTDGRVASVTVTLRPVDICRSRTRTRAMPRHRPAGRTIFACRCRTQRPQNGTRGNSLCALGSCAMRVAWRLADCASGEALARPASSRRRSACLCRHA